MSALGLYLHVPFCSAICNYCNFNRGLLDEGLKRRYVAALEAEIRRVGAGEAADTIFFGGGTPSLLEPEEVAALLDACRRSFSVADAGEITLEMNPETASAGRLSGYRAAGVNRLSLGVQSFRDEELRRLGRMHTAARAAEAVALARGAGFDNISLDLMLWLPQQRPADWRQSLEAAVALAPEHLSLYLLELYPNAPLRDEMARAGWSLAPDEDAAGMYLSGLDRLARAGYRQYEISNVARDGRASRHNLKYWTDGEWLGLGCGAHSTRGGVRWRNVSATADYVARVERGAEVVAERRVLSPGERVEEAMFTALRLTAGVDLDRMQRRYGVEVWERYGDRLEPFVEAGVLERDGQVLRLSRRGMLLANEVMAVFV